MKHLYNFVANIWHKLSRFAQRHAGLTDMYAKALSEAPPPHQFLW